MPFHPPIGIGTFPGGLTTGPSIGGGAFQSFPGSTGSPTGTVFSPPGSPGGGVPRALKDWANFFREGAQTYRILAGGTETIVVAPSQGPPRFEERGPITASLLGSPVVQILLIGGVVFAAVKLLAPTASKK